MKSLNFYNSLGALEGVFEVIRFHGQTPTLRDGRLVIDCSKTKIVEAYSERNKITNNGRAQLAAILSGTRPAAKIGKIELGVGAYGQGVVVNPRLEPPAPTGAETALSVPLTPKFEVEIDEVNGVIIPPNNPMSRIFTVVISPIPGNFDKDMYFGISEFGLKMLSTTSGNTTYDEVLFAVKRRVPIQPDSESSIAIRWTIQM